MDSVHDNTFVRTQTGTNVKEFVTLCQIARCFVITLKIIQDFYGGRLIMFSIVTTRTNYEVPILHVASSVGPKQLSSCCISKYSLYGGSS